MKFIKTKTSGLTSFGILLSFLILGSFNLQAQSTTFKGSWNIIGVKWAPSEKITLGYSHNFIRQNEFFKDRDRTFSDFTVGYKLNATWSFLFLNRYVFVQGDGNDANWIFLDVNHSLKKNKLSLKNRVRLHFGSEWVGEIDQGDFLRYAVIATFPVGKIFTPEASVEPFYSISGEKQFDRVRFEVGSKVKITKKLSGKLIYRLDEFVNRDPGLSAYFFVTSLTYKI